MKLRTFYTLILAITSLAITSCEKPQDSSIPVKFEKLTTENRSVGDTTKLFLTFSGAIEGLTAENIELIAGATGAQKGALTMLSAGTYQLQLNQVKASGEVSIKVSRDGYSITPQQRSVVITHEVGVISNKPFIAAVEKNAKITFTKNAEGNVVVADNQALINNITYLNLFFNELESVDGIEYFTNLKEFICFDNQLTSIDVSKNTMLEYLNCDNNKISSLDVSKNTMLKKLECKLNELSSLDVSKNTMLEMLVVENNQFTSIDVSKNTMLKQLYCCYNMILSLDVSKNTMLETLSCTSNKLTSLDLSKNTLLKDFSCDKNDINALDVSKNTLLETLLCYSNQLTSIDVSKNTMLETFYCGSNNISLLDVTKNSLLKRFICSFNIITTLDISKLLYFEPTSYFYMGPSTLELKVTAAQKAQIDNAPEWTKSNNVKMVVKQ